VSAPEVGDRVRVIAGQWTGWEGVVIDTLTHGHVWIDLQPFGGATWQRCLPAESVEKVPTTAVKAPLSDEQPSDVVLDAP
jgi:ribosomal protein L24